MRCCADVLSALRVVVLALCATLSSAVFAAAQPATDLATRVAEAVAERWGVDAMSVVVEPTGTAEWPATTIDFTLLGSGADGTFVIALESDSRTRLLVRAGVATVERVAARDMERGETIVASDIRIEPVVQWGPPRDASPVEPGWMTRRRVTAGEALRSPAVAPPLAVRAGQDVKIVFMRSGITITLSGRAAGQGAVGERIAVRAETGKRLDGVITADGVVRVDGSTKE